MIPDKFIQNDDNFYNNIKNKSIIAKLTSLLNRIGCSLKNLELKLSLSLYDSKQREDNYLLFEFTK